MSAGVSQPTLVEVQDNNKTAGSDGLLSVSPSSQRENLAGGSGVFANFFKEMAAPHNQDPSVTYDLAEEKRSPYLDFEVPHAVPSNYNRDMISEENPLQAFYENEGNDEDLAILNQYKVFINRNQDDEVPSILYDCEPEHQIWDQFPAKCSLHSNIQEDRPNDLSSNMCISYAQRYKPPKVLANRYLLGETIGRGSYGKVKDAIDLVTLQRHAVKVISKLGVRKIPGGWNQTLLEAALMRRITAHRNIVTLISILRLDQPDRLCLVMEHCLGSVHDLQTAGVPSSAEDFGDDAEFGPELENNRYCATDLRQPSVGTELGSAATNEGSQQRLKTSHLSSIGQGNKGHSNDHFSLNTTDVKPESRKFKDILKFRKVSNVEDSMNPRKRRSPQTSQQQQQFRRLSEAQAHAYFIQLIDGLDFLHRNGVVHRDIKPGNLLLTPAPGCGLGELYSVGEVLGCSDSFWADGDGGNPGFIGRSLVDLLTASRGWLVKLADFGVSAHVSAFSPNDMVSGGQTTPAVQPPEVAKGVQSVFVGSKLDVYSAGVTLYFMLTGHVPFSCNNVLQIFEAIAHGDYTIPGHVSGNAANLIRKMMAKDPKKRYTLDQVARHAWVVNDPPPPMSMEQIEQKVRTHASKAGGSPSHRGFVSWLDPLVYLRRPVTEYPSPHIDESGARIFMMQELDELKMSESQLNVRDNEPAAEGDEDDMSNSFDYTKYYSRFGVPPISLIERLKIYHAWTEHSDDLQKQGPSLQCREMIPDTKYLGLEPRLAELGITTSGSHEWIPPYAHAAMEYNAANTPKNLLNCVPSRVFEQQPQQLAVGESHSYAVPNRGVTLSCTDRITLARLVASSRSHAQLSTGSSVPTLEPPACPEDLPVSSPKHVPVQALMTLEHGGAMRAASFPAHVYDSALLELDATKNGSVREGIQESEQQERPHQQTWHCGSRMNQKAARICKEVGLSKHSDGPQIISTRVVNVRPEEQHQRDLGSTTFFLDDEDSEIPSASVPPPAADRKPPHPHNHSRLSRWIANPISSLWNRLRRARPSNLRLRAGSLCNANTMPPYDDSAQTPQSTRISLNSDSKVSAMRKTPKEKRRFFTIKRDRGKQKQFPQ
ncbi:unnamed protein product [Calicophoron daubneyi]|uniref:non-specific serine/threonine protein kinase n=1 Tax=Calicophoron daubneyi TaxID=300641 RepID=A0AAV2T910_CALDB